MEFVLENKSTIRKIGHEWHATVQDAHFTRFVFNKNPTSEYLRELKNRPFDLRRHVAAVEELRKRILRVSRLCNPFRQVRVVKPEPPCQGCKSTTDYRWCEHQIVCIKCGTVRRKIELGVDYRNIKERSEIEGDRNTVNYHTLDPLLSDAMNRQTLISTAPSKHGEQEMSSRNLNSYQKRLWRDERLPHHITEKDDQIIRAKNIIGEICEDLFLDKSTQNRALTMFCRFVRSRLDLPRVKEVIAACLFEALPPPPKIYPKRKKRQLTPYNDTKKKPLKLMKIKKYGVRARASTL